MKLNKWISQREPVIRGYGLKLLLVTLLVFVSGCYAREMYLVDPVVSFQDKGIKNVLFIGFSSPADIKVPAKVKARLENNLFKEFERFNAIKLIKVDENEMKLYSIHKQSDIDTLAKKYNSDLLVVGDIKSYKEQKYVDQPVPGFSQTSNNPTPNDVNDIKNLVRFQISMEGTISLIKPDGKALWVQKIDELETSQFDESSGTQVNDTNQEEVSAYVNTRERLIESVTNKVISNLLPYYSYK
jgi:hypothetical protein